ncbi:response regulator receiver protein [Emticicia oligotrophica DSM 17448]|uniref:Response regulator receiver protein n=1 Tax=Emticicia oligotrophica (strain DSM 17448 / CIP 109782 / MTCC 6937 / GPTSA100-15) TaxID=929562 RepID=A0ABM5N3Z0_EMTOG|nr:LytTR family DNA-binding domain-containing protein [Emticicia oligotrophica]AFK04188.1 response regulator receiver protein [Emticicia oligotrophica DSM 17448]
MENLNHTQSYSIAKSNNEGKQKQIRLHCFNKFVDVPVEKIIRLEGNCNYTVVHTKNKKYISAKTLKHYECILDENYFIRIHKSHLVNILHTKGLNIQASNSATAIFECGTNLDVSRRKVKTVIERFAHFKKA